MDRTDFSCLLLYLTLAVAIGFADTRMRAYPLHQVDTFIPAVVSGTESAPAKYRVLAPFLDHSLARMTNASPKAVWYFTRLVWIFLAFALTHLYLRTWFPPGAAAGGVTLVAATLPLTFTNSWSHPDHIPELALFMLGAMAIARNSDRLFAVTLAAAALNRETSVFLLALYVAAEPLSRRHLARAALFAFEWLLIYAGLRFARGIEHYDYWQAARNLSDLGVPLSADLYDPYYRLYAYFGIVLFGPMLYLALGPGRRPGFAGRALLVVPVVAIVAFCFSNIIEVRIFTPIYALVLPGVMFGLFAGPAALSAGESKGEHR